MNEEMVQLAEQFNSFWWKMYSDARKIEMSEIAVEIAFRNYEEKWGVTLERTGPTIYFNKEMDEFDLGGYRSGTNSIELNAQLGNHPRGLLEIDGHEGTHCAQEVFMGLDRDSLSEMAKEHYDMLINSSTYAHVDMFGIQTQGLSSIQGFIEHGSGDYAALRHSFYMLDIQEREAQSVEQEFIDAFAQVSGKEQPFSPISYREQAIDVFKQHYHCENLTNDAIFELIDNVQSNICHNITPSDPLEASVTYDFVAMMYEQGPNFDIERFEKIIDPEEKMNQLQNCNQMKINLDEIVQSGALENTINLELIATNGNVVLDNSMLDEIASQNTMLNLDEMLAMDNVGLNIEEGFDKITEQLGEVLEEAVEEIAHGFERIFGA